MDGMGKTGGFLDGWGFQTKAQTDCDENQGNKEGPKKIRARDYLLDYNW